MNLIIGQGVLNQQSEYLKTVASKFAIITDDTIKKLYGESLLEHLKDSDLEVYLFSFPAGEQYKTRETKEFLENQMLEKKMGSDTCIIALGGGVVTDVAGFVAATYCRGIPLVLIPTTLLGMVDASIGGKTGVNVPDGKNMIGCIYQPKKVIIDLKLLKSLPQKELVNGVVEIIKHGLIASYKLFAHLQRHYKKLLELDLSLLEKVILTSCRIKMKIVKEDEKNKGRRDLLNFGHTVGHALETLTNYSLSHGEAVAIGILVESFIAHKLGMLDQHSFIRIRKIFFQYDLPLKLSFMIPVPTMLEVMKMDKKSLRGEPRFVLIDAIGSSKSSCSHVEESVIKQALDWMNDAFGCH